MSAAAAAAAAAAPNASVSKFTLKGENLHKFMKEAPMMRHVYMPVKGLTLGANGQRELNINASNFINATGEITLPGGMKGFEFMKNFATGKELGRIYPSGEILYNKLYNPDMAGNVLHYIGYANKNNTTRKLVESGRLHLVAKKPVRKSMTMKARSYSDYNNSDNANNGNNGNNDNNGNNVSIVTNNNSIGSLNARNWRAISSIKELQRRPQVTRKKHGTKRHNGRNGRNGRK